MAETPSTMIPLGTIAPNFQLRDVLSDKILSFKDCCGSKGTVVAFICNHCPFVIHVNETLISLSNTFKDRGISFVAISSNDVDNYPQDGPDKMKEQGQDLGYPFPYLYDEDQSIAKAYKAACTPDLYLFNYENKLVYRGQLDDSRPGNGIPSTGKNLQEAIEALLYEKPINPIQKPSIGCNIKWKNY